MGLLSFLFGSFNERELRKLKRVADRNPLVRQSVRHSLSTLRPLIEEAKQLAEPDRKQALIELANAATESRHEALRRGATSEEDPDWAAASAGETWLHALLGGSPANIARIESLVSELSR